MYSTCLFCNASLGANETIEHFPVGQRLAYDSARGRLWVVCRNCERWNLSPLESRWEAIEDAERLFRATKLRVATENIGLAKLSDDTELVRIGKPPEIELAVWRYGDQFKKRHRKFVWQSAIVAGVVAIPYSIATHMGLDGPGTPLFVSVGAMMAGPFAQSMFSSRLERWRNRVVPVAAVRDDHDRVLRLTQDNINHATLLSDKGDDWALTMPHVSIKSAGNVSRMLGNKHESDAVHEPVTLHGDAVIKALGTLLPRANRVGSTNKGIETAIKVVQETDNLSTLLKRASEESVFQRNRFASKIRGNLVAYAPEPVRLALEMSLHADDERRAMEGELQQLEQRWRDADAIAKIADELLLPRNIEAQVNSLRNTK